ncbi:hypothetical protein ACFVTC_29170 [Streptomyces sp. NPDC057950]|uniref:hypothetical protein n=1 Tax=Streptomyces sp. NPDC057950 TaxID=3346288 RepID=UPI0036E9F181
MEVEAVPETPEAADAPGEGLRAPQPPGEKSGQSSEQSPEQSSEQRPDAPDGSGVPGARRRGRTTLLIATAAVLGLVAGTCAGYLVQADREPTELPSLSQPVVAQAHGAAPEPLSAAQDRQVKTDGDLRKLLLKRPKGAREADWIGSDGWMDVGEYAESFTKPAGAFRDLVADEFRRAAVTGWKQRSAGTVEVRLLQYRQEEKLAAGDASDNGQYWADEESGTRSWAIPGTGNGMVYVHSKPDTKPGYVPIYGAEAQAWRGDIAMEIWIYDSKPIPKATIMDLAKRQMERL